MKKTKSKTWQSWTVFFNFSKPRDAPRKRWVKGCSFSDSVGKKKNNSKCPLSIAAKSPPWTRKWLQSTVHVILQRGSMPLSYSTPVFCFISFISGNVDPTRQGAERMSWVYLNGDEVSAFLNGCPVGVWRKLWQAGLLSASFVGEHRVLARWTGRAACVWVARRILVQRHR